MKTYNEFLTERIDKKKLTPLIRKFNRLESDLEQVQDDIMDIFNIERPPRFRELQNLSSDITGAIARFRKATEV